MPSLGQELIRALAGTDLVPRVVADREWRLGEVTVIVTAQRAELRYAREPIGWAKLDAGDIVRATQRARARLLARSSPPDTWLPMLAAAYDGVLAATHGSAGARVPLVEVRDALDTTRAQFAWDFARLQREGRLLVGERRIDLGIATGHAVARRSRVVWIENAGGGGAYYETFRLIPEARRDQASTTKAGRGAHRRTSAPNPRSDGRER